MTNHIILNRIQTPDGTVLTSETRHDYSTYKDENGLTYMVDGGTDYLRRTTHADQPHEEMSVYSDDPHEEIREVFKWGTYGPKGDQPIEYVLLKDLSSPHICNILKDCRFMAQWQKAMFDTELRWRRI